MNIQDLMVTGRAIRYQKLLIANELFLKKLSGFKSSIFSKIEKLFKLCIKHSVLFSMTHVSLLV